MDCGKAKGPICKYGFTVEDLKEKEGLKEFFGFKE